jgi:hypothetical protein
MVAKVEGVLTNPLHLVRARQGHSVDALAPGGDEGRGTLRKAMGSREQALIHGCPNGATHRASGIMH